MAKCSTIFFLYQCQVEDKQRGVCEPRNPVAAAVPEECYQQVSRACYATKLHMSTISTKTSTIQTFKIRMNAFTHIL